MSSSGVALPELTTEQADAAVAALAARGFIQTDNLGAPAGVATLDQTGILPETQIPARLAPTALDARDTATDARAADKIKTGKDLPIDLIVLGGQSNAMDKSDWITSGPIDVADPRIMHWDTATGAPVTIPTDHTYLGLYLAQSYLREYPNRRCLIVSAARGDTGLLDVSRPNGTWNRTDATNPINCYNNMVTNTNAARAWIAADTGAALASVKVAAFIWSQGEADARTATQPNYAAKFDDLINAFRTATGDTFNKMPVVIGSLVPEVLFNDATLPWEVPYALEDTPRRKQFTAYIPGPRHFSKYNENVHYSVAGQKRRGALMVDGIRRARMNSAVNEPNLPNNIQVQRSGDNVLVTWDPPYGRVTAYDLLTSTDAGATWTAAAPPRPAATEYRTTVPAATPFQVKIRVTNEVGSTIYTIPEPYIQPAPGYPAPAERYRARDLAAGTIASWPSQLSAPSLTVNAGAPVSTTDTAIKVVTTDGATDRLGATTGTAWKSVAVLVKLPAVTTGEDMILGPVTSSNGQVVYNSATGLVYWRNGDATTISTPAAAGWNVIIVTIDAGGAASLTASAVRVTGTIRDELPPPGIRLAGSFATGQHLAASWADIALWKTVLTAAEGTAWAAQLKTEYPVFLP